MSSAPPKRYRVAVCKGTQCRLNGADSVLAAFKKAIEDQGIVRHCEVYRGGCYGLCEQGANVVIREDTGRKRDPLSGEDYQLMGWDGETYYPEMTAEKAHVIASEHLKGGHEVKALIGQPDPEPPTEG